MADFCASRPPLNLRANEYSKRPKPRRWPRFLGFGPRSVPPGCGGAASRCFAPPVKPISVFIIARHGVSRPQRNHPGFLIGTEAVGTDRSVLGKGGTCPVGRPAA